MNQDFDRQQEYVASLYEHYADALFRFVYWKTSDKDVAIDVVQETFTKTWDYLLKGNDVDNIKAFLYRVAGNLVIDYHRKKKSTSLEYLMANGMDIDAEDTGHEKEILKMEFSQIHELLDHLSDRERELITFRYIEDMSISEIAEALQERPNTISVALHRAVEKIKTKVATQDQSYE